MKFNASRKKHVRMGDYYIDVETKLPWGKLTPKEQSQKIKKAGALTALVATAIYGIGAPGDNLPQSQIDTAIKTEAGNFYKTRTDAYKFAAAYLDIYRTNNGVAEQVGAKRGLALYDNMFSGRTVYIGQACLANTAYDTRPSSIRGLSSGDLSAVASIASTPESLTVHPAGSNVASLNFTYQDKVLVPSPETKHTLSSYGCADGLQIFNRGVGANAPNPNTGARPDMVISFEDLAK
ncbi:hypothetical protein KC976_00930 [Candidatus Saccharibacteria bacterium]|nr:hypothetical protein [Candidatus Saccharibacteria bacterium]